MNLKVLLTALSAIAILGAVDAAYAGKKQTTAKATKTKVAIGRCLDSPTCSVGYDKVEGKAYLFGEDGSWAICDFGGSCTKQPTDWRAKKTPVRPTRGDVINEHSRDSNSGE